MEIEIQESWTITEILNKIREINYLPNIYGGVATWSVAIKQPIAVISQGNANLKLICLPDFPYQGTKGFVEFDHIHFNYHEQKDANEVFEVLRNFKIK